MEITLNNQKITLEDNETLQGLINRQLGDKQKGVAVAIEGNVIPRIKWQETTLQNNQSVIIIKATQGG